MESTYAFNTHNICPDTGDIYDLSVAIETSDFISVEAILAEVKRLSAAPIRRPIFTKGLGQFCESRCERGSVKSNWSDFDGAVSDFHASCTYCWAKIG